MLDFVELCSFFDENTRNSRNRKNTRNFRKNTHNCLKKPGFFPKKTHNSIPVIWGP